MTQHVAADRSSPDDRSARARIGAAGKLLRDSKTGVPDGFAALMFARTAPEDLVRYDAAEIAVLAREAWTFFGTRKPGAPKIRFESPDASWGDRLKTISVIEMVNDDMPFLVDSVMGELTERGLDVRLVAHPIIAAERDKGGKLKSEPRRGRRAATAGRAKASSTSMSSASPMTRAAPRSCRRWSRCWPQVRVCRAGLAADGRARRGRHQGAEKQSAAGAGGRHRRGDPVPRMARRPTISRCSASAITPLPARAGSSRR